MDRLRHLGNPLTVCQIRSPWTSTSPPSKRPSGPRPGPGSRRTSPPRPLPSLDTADGFEAHRAWERTLFDDRWSVVSWPTEYGGRDVGIMEWLIFEEEYYRARAPKRVSQNGIFLLAPTMLEYGTEAQKARYLPPMASGDEIWCQGWSEPDAGSDLAGIRSRAGAQHRRRRLAAHGPEDLGQPGRLRRMVLRHLPHRPRGRAPPGAHLLPHPHGRARASPCGRSPRSTARPVSPRSSSTTSRCPTSRCWARSAPAGRSPWRPPAASAGSACAARPATPRRPAASLPLFDQRGGARPSVRRRRRPGLHGRRGLQAPHLLDRHQGPRATPSAPRPVATRSSGPRPTWPSTRPRLSLLGPDAELLESGAPGDWLDGYLFSLAGPIYAGTNEIQRNVVAERLLGLPRG